MYDWRPPQKQLTSGLCIYYLLFLSESQALKLPSKHVNKETIVYYYSKFSVDVDSSINAVFIYCVMVLVFYVLSVCFLYAYVICVECILACFIIGCTAFTVVR